MYFRLTIKHRQTAEIRTFTLDTVDMEEAHEQMGYLLTPRWEGISLIEISAEQVAAEEAAEDAAYAAAGHRVI